MALIENLTLILSLVLGLITLITYVIRAATKNTNAIARSRPYYKAYRAVSALQHQRQSPMMNRVSFLKLNL